MEHIAYRKTPSIVDCFRSVAKSHRNFDQSSLSYRLPVVNAKATIKLHGTNGGIVHDGKNMWFQSRNNIVTVGSDNAGFASFCEQRRNQLEAIVSMIRSYNELDDNDVICIYGEFVGSGIFNVGVSKLEKRFFIFSVECNGKQLNHPLIAADEINIHNIEAYDSFEFDLDFNDYNGVLEKLQPIVDQIDKACPVAKAFGVDGVGEGVVVRFEIEGNSFVFKMKGQSHTESKVKVAKPKDSVSVDQEVIDYVCSIARLEQQYHIVANTLNGGVGDRSMIGGYIRAVSADIIAECTEYLQEKGIEYKKIGGIVATVCRQYFLAKLEEAVC